MAECDVLVVGAGPAGAIAGLVLARAGARVRLVDRATFPRDKLCGDTVNPGAMAALHRLGVAGEVEARGLAVHGMLVTGEDGVAIRGRYPGHLRGRALLRRDLDWILLEHAVAAGCAFEPGVAARGVCLTDRHGRPVVAGVSTGDERSGREMRAEVTIAADGRRSAITFGLGLARHPARPRRWAIGAYFSGVAPASAESMGEMHVRRQRYIGVAPVPGGLTNVCLVRPSFAGDPELRDPLAALRRAVAEDPLLRDRFVSARPETPAVTLGPLAVDVLPSVLDGLLLAGDAAGFIDPMTGDGLRFAIRGGELAALAALRALEHGWAGVARGLERDRGREFRGKWRFNRALRTLVGSPPAVRLGAAGARLAPALLRAVIARAGDCHAAGR